MIVRLSRLCAVYSPLVLALASSGCAKHEEADPVPVSIALEFPSTPAAVVTDSLRILVFDGQPGCSELVTMRRSNLALPDTKVELESTPCDLATTGTFEVDRSQPYTVLVVAQRGQKDFLVGCAPQSQFGDVQSLPVQLAYASNEYTLSTVEGETPGATTKCAHLSDKCSGACN